MSADTPVIIKMNDEILAINKIAPEVEDHNRFVDLTFKNITYEVSMPNPSNKADGITNYR